MENQTSPQNPPEVFVQQPKPNHSKTVLFSIIGVTLLTAIIFLYFQNQQLKKQAVNQQISPIIQSPSPIPQTVSSISVPPDETAGWKTYENIKYNYSLRYPKEWTVKSIEPGPADLPLNNTSRGIVVFPSIYKSSAEAQALVQLETDGPENTAFKGFDDWLNNLHQSFFKVETTTQDGFAGLSGETSTGTYDGYGFPAIIKRFALKSFDGKTYYTITTTLEKSSQEKTTVDQILSTFKFIDDRSVCVPVYKVETNSTELTAKQNYSMHCSEQRSEKDCFSIDLYNQKADEFSIPDGIPDCIWKNPINTI